MRATRPHDLREARCPGIPHCDGSGFGECLKAGRWSSSRKNSRGVLHRLVAVETDRR